MRITRLFQLAFVAVMAGSTANSALVTTTTTLVITPKTAAFGSLFTLTASVKDQTGTPVTNGRVTFYDGKTALGTVQLVSTTSGGATIGTATLKTIVVPLGANSITAKYVGGDAPSTSAAVAATVTGKYPTTTTFAYSGSGCNYTFTGTVAGAGPIKPTGNVAFADKTTGAASGTAMLNPATLVQTFVSAPTLTGFSNPVWAAFADVNGDGIPDLFVGDSIGVTVELGNGDGTFRAPSLVLSGRNDTSPSSGHLGIAFGDFNGDGKLDAAVAIGGNIIVLLGNGDGTFETDGSYDSGNPNEPIVADFNGDGILDIVAFNTSTVDLLLGNGDGTFKAPVSEPVSSPLSVAVGDLNGDGKADVVVATAPNDVRVFFGSANGTLQPGSTFVTQYEPGNMILADFRGNGKLDLVTAFNQCCEGTDTAVNLMLGNGDGTFQPEYPILSGTNFSGLAPADFNGDGKLDLIVSDYGFPAINVLFGKGDGTFQSAISYSVGIGPISLPVADLNHDGRPDIAVANFNSNTVDILLNRVTQTAKLSHALVPGVGQQSVTASYPGDTHFATSTSQSVPLSANTVVKLVPISLSFGDQLVGTTSTAKAVTMTNVGTTALTINGISLTGINAGDFSQTHTCGGTLGAGASCTISVKFHPSATGARSAAVSISDNGGCSPQKVLLSGTGTVVKLVPTSLSFGNQPVGTTSAAKSVTMTNIGTTTVTINGISLTGINAGDFSQTHTCGGTLGAGASCTISVKFHPSATGARSAAVSISDNGGGSPQKVPLSGTGT